MCKVFKVKPLKTPKPDVHQRRQHTIYSAERFERPKKSCRVFQFPSAIISKEWKKVKASEKNFTKERNNDMNRYCKDIKKIMRMK